jgi:hypothetical protein
MQIILLLAVSRCSTARTSFSMLIKRVFLACSGTSYLKGRVFLLSRRKRSRSCSRVIADRARVSKDHDAALALSEPPFEITQLANRFKDTPAAGLDAFDGTPVSI